MRERRLTVATAFYPRLSPDDGTQGADRRIPAIRLRGLWLQHAGFKPRQTLRVRIAPGCLVITAE